MSCLVEGRLSIRSYEDKDGNKRKATEVVANVMQMLDRAGGGGGRPGNDGGSYENVRPLPARGGSGGGEFDDAALEDEIPF